MRRLSALLTLALALACNGDPAGTTSAGGTSTTATTTTTDDAPTSSSTAEGLTTSTSDGSDSDGATTGPASTTTEATETTTTWANETTTTTAETTATTTTDGTTAPVDLCDPDPCAAPQHCEDGVCQDPSPPGEGEVVVVEMMIDPAQLSDYDAEWFELLNITEKHLDLNGCRLVDLGVNDNDHTIDAGGPLVIGPGALMVMAKTTDAAANGGIADVAYGFAQEFSLTNTGDALILRCADVDIDVVEFAPMTWPYGVGVGMQLGLADADAAANDDPAAWCAAITEYTDANTGTPGAANPPCR
jgi:hypothetical protein